MNRLRALLLPPGWDASPSQGTQHEAIRRITAPPGWDAGPAKGTQHDAIRSITAPPLHMVDAPSVRKLYCPDVIGFYCGLNEASLLFWSIAL